MNTSFSGLKQIHVGEGMILEMTGAQEVSFSLSPCNSKLSNGSFQRKEGRIDLWPVERSSCMPLLTICVVGSALVTPFRKYNAGSTIKRRLLSKDVAELITKKCHTKYMYRKAPCPVNLSSRIVVVQRLLRRLLGEIQQHQNHLLSLHKGNMKVSTIVQFQPDLKTEFSA